jgi:transposase
VGVADWRALERFAGAFSLATDVLAPLPSLDRSRSVEEGLGSPLAKARSPRPNPVARSNRRRHVFLGEKRGECVGKTKRGKGTKTMVLSDGRGLPLGAEIASASPHEVTLIEPLVEQRILPKKPRRLIYDAAADSDPLRKRLWRRGIELVCPHRKNRKASPTQDGRKLRRHRRRWKIERSISWLQNFRRLVTRYEYYAHLFHGFVQLACLMVVMRRF